MVCFVLHTFTDSFIFDISCYTNVECMPRGPLPFSLPFILLVDACVRSWATSPHIPSFSSCFILIDLYYDNLGVWIKGESPDGAPHLITCE
jgi:hypothetical protein